MAKKHLILFLPKIFKAIKTCMEFHRSEQRIILSCGICHYEGAALHQNLSEITQYLGSFFSIMQNMLPCDDASLRAAAT